MSNWEKVRLEDVCIRITDGSHFSPVSTIDGFPMASVKDMSDYGLDLKSSRKISETDYNKLVANGCKPAINDVLIAKDGNSMLETVCVMKSDIKCVILSSIAILCPDVSKISPGYLMYVLRDRKTKGLMLSGYKSGSAIPRMVLKDFKRFPISLPPLSVQRHIAAILSSLDDKIENNRKTCEKLEEIAQAIFKRWFVDFEFPNEDGLPYKSSGGVMVYCEELGKEIPKGWRVGSIGDYCTVKSGYAFKSSWWQDKGIPVIKIKGISNNTIDFSQSEYVDEQKAKLASEFNVNGGDLLIAMTGATIGKFGIVPYIKPYALVNQRVGKFFLGNDPFKKLGFIYNLLLQPDIYKEIVSRGEGSAQPNISPANILSVPIILPPESIINNYNELVSPLFKMNIKNQKQSSSLQQIRDALLPKLMSGELAVEEGEVG